MGKLIVSSFSNLLYQARSYILSTDDSRESLIIDPGNPDISEIVNHMTLQGKTIGTIVLTHEHYDHIAGVNALRQKYDCCLICSGECSRDIIDPAKNFSRYLIGTDFVCSPADVTCEALDSQLDWGGFVVNFLHTPGHSRGSICIAVDSCLFAGDTLIQDVCTVTKLPGGNKDVLKTSIETIFKSMGKNTVVYPGHGSKFDLSEVKPDVVLGIGYGSSARNVIEQSKCNKR